MFIIARATEPALPDWRVSTRTIDKFSEIKE
jgi:hypothetical protein